MDFCDPDPDPNAVELRKKSFLCGALMPTASAVLPRENLMRFLRENTTLWYESKKVYQ